VTVEERKTDGLSRPAASWSRRPISFRIDTAAGGKEISFLYEGRVLGDEITVRSGRRAMPRRPLSSGKRPGPEDRRRHRQVGSEPRAQSRRRPAMTGP